MIHGVDIAFLFTPFKRLRLEREQIRQILLDLEQLISDTSFTLEKLKASATSSSGREAALPATTSRWAFDRAASQILNKTKNFFESLKYYLRM